MDFVISPSFKQTFFEKMKKERWRSQAKIKRAFGWTRWMRKWVKNNADFLKVHLKYFLLLWYPAPFRLLGVSLDSFELSFLISWIISTQKYKTVWNITNLYNKNHLDMYIVWFFFNKSWALWGLFRFFFRTDKKFWHGVFIIFSKVCSLDVRIFDTDIYSLEFHSENIQFQSFKIKKYNFL